MQEFQNWLRRINLVLKKFYSLAAPLSPIIQNFFHFYFKVFHFFSYLIVKNMYASEKLIESFVDGSEISLFNHLKREKFEKIVFAFELFLEIIFTYSNSHKFLGGTIFQVFSTSNIFY